MSDSSTNIYLSTGEIEIVGGAILCRLLGLFYVNVVLCLKLKWRVTFLLYSCILEHYAEEKEK